MGHSSWDNPIAITKHPEGTASFCIRLCTKKGTRYQTMLCEPKPIAEMPETLQKQLNDIRKFFASAQAD